MFMKPIATLKAKEDHVLNIYLYCNPYGAALFCFFACLIHLMFKGVIYESPKQGDSFPE